MSSACSPFLTLSQAQETDQLFVMPHVQAGDNAG